MKSVFAEAGEIGVEGEDVGDLEPVHKNERDTIREREGVMAVSAEQPPGVLLELAVHPFEAHHTASEFLAQLDLFLLVTREPCHELRKYVGAREQIPVLAGAYDVCERRRPAVVLVIGLFEGDKCACIDEQSARHLILACCGLRNRVFGRCVWAFARKENRCRIDPRGSRSGPFRQPGERIRQRSVPFGVLSPGE